MLAGQARPIDRMLAWAGTDYLARARMLHADARVRNLEAYLDGRRADGLAGARASLGRAGTGRDSPADHSVCAIYEARTARRKTGGTWSVGTL